ncbi:uncharacterized protein N7483_000561 [Penicillium malachiteum]|uniref:uncharacterized protein n=1 Tax=Penicillium malachiteum TaxID=1324776 RepID=UPI002546D343|nr:uncharacterized protein N7483_000561 [Penicillium malachiteum]KAJ5735436.1 hypothetical protein N7483_000561 [Penicillium malachiteum]
MSATLADPYRGFAVTFTQAEKPDDHDLITYDATQSQAREKMLSSLSYHSDDASTSSFGSHSLQAGLPLPEPQTNGTHEPQSNFLPVHQLLHPPHYSYDNISYSSDARRRSHTGSEIDNPRDMELPLPVGLPQPVHPMPMDGSGPGISESEMHFPSLQNDHSGSHPSSNHGYASPMSLSLPLPIPQHHHHRLPSQAGLLSNFHNHGSPTSRMGPPNLVGQPGMPRPANRPRAPKLKFKPEEDALLIDLKEERRLTWKQISDFFPGRTSGTLQVRYCTKLKSKDVNWTEEMINRLDKALRDYEDDRWRVVAAKVGHGFTPAACRIRALNLDPEEEGMEDPHDMVDHIEVDDIEVQHGIEVHRALEAQHALEAQRAIEGRH